MIFYTIYIEKTGEIVLTGTANQEVEISNITGQDQKYILELSKENQYVENGKVIDMPPKPEGEYVFDYSVKQWVFDTQKATNKALFKRDALLADGPDRISPLWWDSMTVEVKAAWTKYRQDLLDVPNQPGFPKTIVWPTRPDVG